MKSFYSDDNFNVYADQIAACIRETRGDWNPCPEHRKDQHGILVRFGGGWQQVDYFIKYKSAEEADKAFRAIGAAMKKGEQEPQTDYKKQDEEFRKRVEEEKKKEGE